MKTCAKCNKEFPIYDEDRKFYEMFEVPEPTFCPLCRMQRRLSFRSERFLYHRKCDLSGKQIISTYSADVPWPVYENEEWWSDKWDAKEYGRDFDFSRPFFEQYFELRDSVPRLALSQQQPMINSTYCNTAGHCTNCYLCFSSNGNENCMYSSWINYCKFTIDSKSVTKCELCYECVDCRDCYNLKWSQNCTNCSDSYFLFNCKGTRNSFGCSNLVDKEYYIFNKPHTKEQYEAFMAQIDLGSHSTIEKLKSKVKEEIGDLVVKEFEGVNNENSLGNYIRNNKNAFMSFDCDDSEDLRYCQGVYKGKLSMDHTHWGDGTEKVYESQAIGYIGTNIRFSNLAFHGGSDLTYCDHMVSSKECFGSVGLYKGEYCILNKQYPKEEYFKLKDKIIEHMKTTGEWGEFFPSKYSNYGYNETMAHEEFPLTKEEALAQGFRWKDEADKHKHYKGPVYEIPDNINDVKDDIIDSILVSEETGVPYKITPQELKFYRENNIPIPRKPFNERHWERVKKRNPRILFDRNCAKCNKDIKTTYSPDRPEQVYCETCYLKEVY